MHAYSHTLYAHRKWNEVTNTLGSMLIYGTIPHRPVCALEAHVSFNSYSTENLKVGVLLELGVGAVLVTAL